MKSMRLIPVFVLLALFACEAKAYTFIEGKVPQDAQPDGNSILIEGPAEMLVIDTGRHPEHTDKIIAAAKARNKPITAIINNPAAPESRKADVRLYLDAMNDSANLIPDHPVDGPTTIRPRPSMRTPRARRATSRPQAAWRPGCSRASRSPPPIPIPSTCKPRSRTTSTRCCARPPDAPSSAANSLI
jgi:hypothetical protein